jgi:hypothetical protein
MEGNDITRKDLDSLLMLMESPNLDGFIIIYGARKVALDPKLLVEVVKWARLGLAE